RFSEVPQDRQLQGGSGVKPTSRRSATFPEKFFESRWRVDGQITCWCGRRYHETTGTIPGGLARCDLGKLQSAMHQSDTKFSLPTRRTVPLRDYGRGAKLPG